MAHKTRHPVQEWIIANPCFYLFAALLLLLILLPMFQDSEEGKLWWTAMNLPVLVSSVVALGRARFVFWGALLLAGSAFGLLVASHFEGGSGYLAWSWRFSVGVFALTLVHLVRYVLHPGAPAGMTIDRLYGGAAAYLLLGLLWCYFYALREHFVPDSFAGLGPQPSAAHRRPHLFQLRLAHHGRRGEPRSSGESGADAGAPGRSGRHAVHGSVRRAARGDVFERTPMSRGWYNTLYLSCMRSETGGACHARTLNR
jgi:hypothetical protein